MHAGRIFRFARAGGRRRRGIILGLVASIGAISIFTITNALAVHDTGAFELDGNAVSNLTDDWDRVCKKVTITDDTKSLIPDQCAGAGTLANTATAVSWSAEANPNSSIFTGGGSKDPIDISSWAWKDGAGGLPDKDNLEHSFAVRYSLPVDRVDGPPGGGDLSNGTACPSLPNKTTCEVLYFGSDRFDNSGDAQQGFWFFQNKITLGSVKSGGGFNFSGVHKNGDVLVISDFSNGGTTSTITVYKWNDAVSGNLELLATSDNAGCATAADGDGFCGIVNPTENPLTTAPWSFTDKSGNNNYLNGELYEGGINLSTLGLGDECFASVASETRSSTSTTATLKDFVLGNFAQCGATASTTPSAKLPSLGGATVTPGTSVTDTAVITGTGVSSPPNPFSPASVVFTFCGPIPSSSTVLACDGSNAAHTPTVSQTAGSKELYHCTGAGTAVKGNPPAAATPPTGLCTQADSQGVSRALSDAINTSGSKLSAGVYCFKATWAGDTNYPDGASHIGNASTGTECFQVKDTSTTTTAQSWIPEDTATVKNSSNQNASGTVSFTLYSNGTCTAGTNDVNVIHTFSDVALVNGTASTNNSTVSGGPYGVVTSPGAARSWQVTYTPSDSNAIGGSTSVCETTTGMVIDDDGP
jgi:hypothetical protein